LFATDILKVIYAPHKAFKGIIQNPKYFGPTLIVILFIAASMGSTYAAISKTCIEKTLPDGKLLDEWTENRTLWTSNAGITESNDGMNGSYYGNKSIAFSITNNTEVWAQLKDIGPVNCSGPDGYSKLSFRIKWTNPEVKPANATIQILSTISSEYFSYNLTGALPNFTYNVWNNLTLQLASNKWSNSSSAASWDNITALKLDFAWTDSSNITLLVDGLFFRGIFSSPSGSATMTYLINYAFVALTHILLVWVFVTGLVYLMVRGLRGNVLWKPVLIVIGFALVTLAIQSFVGIAVFLNLPKLYYPLEYIGGVAGEREIAYNAFVEQTWLVSEIIGYIQIIVHIWTIALSSLAVRFLTGFGWTKSFFIGASAYLVTILIAGFLGF
jgi:hypothetical protein